MDKTLSTPLDSAVLPDPAKAVLLIPNYPNDEKKYLGGDPIMLKCAWGTPRTGTTTSSIV